MSIELQLSTGDEEWTFNMTESIVPGPGDGLTIEDPDGHLRDFRVAGRRDHNPSGRACWISHSRHRLGAGLTRRDSRQHVTRSLGAPGACSARGANRLAERTQGRAGT